MRFIINYAYHNVRFYHELYRNHGIHPENLHSKADWKKLPIITKEDVRNNYLNFISKEYNLWNCFRNYSSGSTGEPLVIIVSPESRNLSRAIGMREFLTFKDIIGGYSLRRVAGLIQPYEVFTRRGLGYLFLWNRFMKVLTSPVHHQISWLNRIKPTFMVAPSSALELIARSVEKGFKLNFTPKLLFCGSETTTKKRREYIEGILNVKIKEIYGCAEFGHLAWECDANNGYHINEDSIFLELGEQSETKIREKLVITGLDNLAMPIIRYEVNDGVKLSNRDETCSCGVKFAKIKEIYGKVLQILQLPSGKLVSPWNLLVLIPGQIVHNRFLFKGKGTTGIKGLIWKRFVQETPNKLIVEYAANKNKEKIPQIIISKLTNYLKEDIEIVPKEVSLDIPNKHMRVIRKFNLT